MASPVNTKSGERAVTHGRKSGHFARFLAFMERAGEVARQRRALLRLDDHALKDIGISRADAWREGGRPWWDLPAR